MKSIAALSIVSFALAQNTTIATNVTIISTNTTTSGSTSNVPTANTPANFTLQTGTGTTLNYINTYHFGAALNYAVGSPNATGGPTTYYLQGNRLLVGGNLNVPFQGSVYLGGGTSGALQLSVGTYDLSNFSNVGGLLALNSNAQNWFYCSVSSFGQTIPNVVVYTTNGQLPVVSNNTNSNTGAATNSSSSTNVGNNYGIILPSTCARINNGIRLVAANGTSTSTFTASTASAPQTPSVTILPITPVVPTQSQSSVAVTPTSRPPPAQVNVASNAKLGSLILGIAGLAALF